jgi:hypothetical protein
LDEDARYEIQAEVLADMARLLLAKDDAGDFLEVRFWLYLRRKAITSRAALLRARRRLPLVDDLVGGDEEQASAILSVPSGDLSPEDRVLLKDGLARLPPELRELMILRYLEGWRVGDELPGRRDPNDPTLSERYAITPRAVRKRLARAEAFLTDSKGTPHAN